MQKLYYDRARSGFIFYPSKNQTVQIPSTYVHQESKYNRRACPPNRNQIIEQCFHQGLFFSIPTNSNGGVKFKSKAGFVKKKIKQNLSFNLLLWVRRLGSLMHLFHNQKQLAIDFVTFKSHLAKYCINPFFNSALRWGIIPFKMSAYSTLKLILD